MSGKSTTILKTAHDEILIRSPNQCVSSYLAPSSTVFLGALKDAIYLRELAVTPYKGKITTLRLTFTKA
jgi:hypothetical protein